MVVLLTPCTSPNLGRFLVCYSESLARISSDVKDWLETWGRCVKTEFVFMATGWGMEIHILSFLLLLLCFFLTKIPGSAFYLLLSFSSFTSSCQSGMSGIDFCKEEKSVSWNILCWSQLVALGESYREEREMIFIQFPWPYALSARCAGLRQFIFESVLASNT